MVVKLVIDDEWSGCQSGDQLETWVCHYMNDLSAVRSIGSWNLSSSFLETFAWTADFNPHTVHQTIAQTWIHLHGLARDY